MSSSRKHRKCCSASEVVDEPKVHLPRPAYDMRVALDDDLYARPNVLRNFCWRPPSVTNGVRDEQMPPCVSAEPSTCTVTW